MTDLNRAMNSNAAPYWAPTATKPTPAPQMPLPATDAAPGPYIPPALRGRSAVVRSAGVVGQFLSNNPATIISGTAVTPVSAAPAANPELPWIDTFLEAPVSATSASVESPADVSPANDIGGTIAETFATQDFIDVEPPASEAQDEGPATIEATAEVVAPPASDEVWPLEDAGQEMTELANGIAPGIEASANVEASPSQDSSETPPLPVSEPTPLPMWNDEEWMDIMPMSPAIHKSSEPEPRERPWADVAREVAARRSEVESAASALESLAQRVRSGELPLPGYQPGLGDAAALAAALAALLGVRR